MFRRYLRRNMREIDVNLNSRPSNGFFYEFRDFLTISRNNEFFPFSANEFFIKLIN